MPARFVAAGLYVCTYESPRAFAPEWWGNPSMTPSFATTALFRVGKGAKKRLMESLRRLDLG